jgi:hypothetical protein
MFKVSLPRRWEDFGAAGFGADAFGTSDGPASAVAAESGADRKDDFGAAGFGADAFGTSDGPASAVAAESGADRKDERLLLVGMS